MGKEEVIEMEKIFWTTKNGAVGTAHKNRKQEMVDFRPAAQITGDEKTITVYPPKGQVNGVESLKLEVTRIEKRVTKSEDLQVGLQRVEEVGFTVFEGLEVSATLRIYTEWYDKEAETANTVARIE